MVSGLGSLVWILGLYDRSMTKVGGNILLQCQRGVEARKKWMRSSGEK